LEGNAGRTPCYATLLGRKYVYDALCEKTVINFYSNDFYDVKFYCLKFSPKKFRNVKKLNIKIYGNKIYDNVFMTP